MIDIISFLLLLSIFSGTKEARLPFQLVITTEWLLLWVLVSPFSFLNWLFFVNLQLHRSAMLTWQLLSWERSWSSKISLRRPQAMVAWQLQDQSLLRSSQNSKTTLPTPCSSVRLEEAISNNVQKSVFPQTWLLVVIGFYNFHLRISLGLKGNETKGLLCVFFVTFR